MPVPDCHGDNGPSSWWRQCRCRTRRPVKRPSCWTHDTRFCRWPASNRSCPARRTAAAAVSVGHGVGGRPIVTTRVWPADRRPVAAPVWCCTRRLAPPLPRPVAVAFAGTTAAAAAVVETATVVVCGPAATTGRRNADGDPAETSPWTPGRRSWTRSSPDRRRPGMMAVAGSWPMPTSRPATIVDTTASSVCSATINCNCNSRRRRRCQRRRRHRRCNRRRRCRRRRNALVRPVRYLRIAWRRSKEVCCRRVWK